MKRLAVLLCSLFFTFSVQAKELAGVTLAPSIKDADHSLQLNGAGVRSKFFMNLYVGSLYTSAPAKTSEVILDGKVLAAVRLDIISGMITSDRMVSTVEEGFMASTANNVAPLQERIDEFLAVFTQSEIKKGEVFTLVGKPGVGVIAYRNGKKAAEVKGDDFRKALFGIWLGDKPADRKLKAAMLGQ
ncbi:chalcone isomerase family protein [Sansalvadorimonas verongulae]|uniref:chalcone isomerase family protein n=1 Tax=Sansalvadorimonas verongulae TaxID=2172824 RepID=UPI0012BC285E|nr:chalcone isomerase family protein [Sansalvadorimonas verongulae]MTI15505.1 chalcone isomerase [Sansalvadorimonas verongulae]